jgi:membrane-bound lytic murein transglycosylase B
MKLHIVFALIICVLWSGEAWASENFENWLRGVRQEALAKGISEPIVNEALAGIKPIPKIIALDRKQPEGKISFAKYRSNVVTQDRIEKGRRLMREHAGILQEVSDHYGVPPQFLVALWGIETSFGGNTGGYGVIEALATLAHDGRRSEFFRGELMNALKILDQGHIGLSDMKGSWAGAMGQNQFMPSSFNAYAVDYNKDGHRNIWTSLPDVFASSANYLSKHGWREDERWGRAVKLPQGFPKSLTGLDTEKSLAEWKGMGVTLANGEPLPNVEDMRGSIVTPDGLGGSAFLAYDNYRVIMKWNKSTYFATSVGLLADALADRGVNY